MYGTVHVGTICGVSLIFLGVLYFYCSFVNLRLIVEEWNEYLESGAIAVHPLLPEVSILDVVGSTLCCRMYRMNLKGAKSWFETLVSCALLQYGGTTLTGFFLGQLPPWLMTWPPFTGFLISWWLIFFCPDDLYWKFVSHPVVLAIYAFMGVFNNGHGVTSWGVDHALFNQFHANPQDINYSYIAAILCGTLSCCGGTLLCDWFQFTEHASYTMSQTPGVFKVGFYSVSREVNASFLLSALYYILVNTHGFLNLHIGMSAAQARALVLLVQYYIFFVQSLLPEDINVFELCSNFMLRALLIAPVINGADYDAEGNLIKIIDPVGEGSPTVSHVSRLSSSSDTPSNRNSSKKRR